MAETYTLIFDEVMLKQLQSAAKNKALQEILTKMLDKLELLGPRAGKLLDSHLFLYELKSKHPPIRMYFRHNHQTDEIYVFEFEMKTGEKEQQRTISRLRMRSSES